MQLRLYSREWCSWCIDAKDYLSEKGYCFQEIDVGKDRQAYEEMKQLSAQTYVPTFVAGDKVLANFDTESASKISERASDQSVDALFRDAFRSPSYARRSRAERRSTHVSQFVCAKGRGAGDSRRHVSWILFCYQQLGVGFGRGSSLAVSALAGNSHPDPCVTTSKRKTASTEKSAIVRHVPGA